MFPEKKPESRRRWLMPTLIVLAVLVVIAAGCLFWRRSLPKPDSSVYQAVFLTNGQVYFGKLQNAYSRAPVLEDVYYLQVNQPLQQGQTAAGKNASSTSQQPQFALMKLGQTEVHGPQDKLFLMDQQILFWENLKPDSQVIQTIDQFKKQSTKQ